MARLSCILSTFHRPLELQLMLLSLRTQTERDIEILIADNSSDDQIAAANQAAAEADSRIFYHRSYFNNPYQAADIVSHYATGEYICFPSDDGYYVPVFAESMVSCARLMGWDLVYCDMVYDPRLLGRYGACDVKPELGFIDKTGFIVKREWFTGFPGEPGAALADWYLIEDLMKRGISHGKLNQLLVVHN